MYTIFLLTPKDEIAKFCYVNSYSDLDIAFNLITQLFTVEIEEKGYKIEVRRRKDE